MMRPVTRRRLLPLLFAAFGPPATGAILDSDDGGFTVASSVVIDAPRTAVYSTFVDDLNRWWSPELTVSGYAEALYLDPRPMGCFCETLGAGSGIVHMTVTLVNTNSMIRLTGSLGPLGLLGTSGNMTFEFEDTETGTLVSMQYAVGGYRPGGLGALAPDVDAVLADQLGRLKRFAETGDAVATP